MKKKVVTIVGLVVFIFVSSLAVRNVAAMGQVPSDCTNLYNSSIASFELNTNLVNDNRTLSVPVGASYVLTIVFQVAPRSVSGDTDPGESWFNSNMYGYYDGICFGTVNPGQRWTLAYGVSSTEAAIGPQGATQVVYVDALTGPGFEYTIDWVPQGGSTGGGTTASTITTTKTVNVPATTTTTTTATETITQNYTVASLSATTLTTTKMVPKATTLTGENITVTQTQIQTQTERATETKTVQVFVPTAQTQQTQGSAVVIPINSIVFWGLAGAGIASVGYIGYALARLSRGGKTDNTAATK